MSELKGETYLRKEVKMIWRDWRNLLIQKWLEAPLFAESEEEWVTLIKTHRTRFLDHKGEYVYPAFSKKTGVCYLINNSDRSTIFCLAPRKSGSKLK